MTTFKSSVDRFESVPVRRDDGTPAQIGDWWWVENGRIHFAQYTGPIGPPITLLTSSGPVTLGVPNRLYGAEINDRGEAV